MKLYIKRLGVEKLNMKVDTFTKKLFDIDDEYPSMAIDETFTDELFVDKQCGAHRRRSIDDLIVIYRTYLGNIHIKTILQSLERVILTSKKGALLFCPTAKRWVIHEYIGGIHIGKKVYTRRYHNGETRKYTESGSGKITLKYILDTLGFKDHSC